MKQITPLYEKSIHWVLSLICCFFCVFAASHSLAQQEEAYTVSEVKLISHRGMNMGYPENSLAAMEAVIKHGIHGMEVDLRTSADGHIVIIHDENVERTTTGCGPVREISWQALQKLRLKDKAGKPSVYYVPDLHSVLTLAQQYPHFSLALDLKDVDAIKVAKMVLALRMEEQVFFFVASPMNTSLAKSITSLDPRLKITVDMLSWWKIEDIPLFTARALETHTLFASEWFFPKRGFHHLHQEGIDVIVYLWGKHDLVTRFHKAVKLGANMISTDEPLSLLPHVVPALPVHSVHKR